MLIWSRLGFLAFLIPFLSLLISEFITREITEDSLYYSSHSLPQGIPLFVSAIVVYFLGKWLNTKKVRIYIEESSGKKVIAGHTFFFLRMEYWGFVILAVSMAVLFLK